MGAYRQGLKLHPGSIGARNLDAIHIDMGVSFPRYVRAVDAFGIEGKPGHVDMQVAALGSIGMQGDPDRWGRGARFDHTGMIVTVHIALAMIVRGMVVHTVTMMMTFKLHPGPRRKKKAETGSEKQADQ